MSQEEITVIREKITECISNAVDYENRGGNYNALDQLHHAQTYLKILIKEPDLTRITHSGKCREHNRKREPSSIGECICDEQEIIKCDCDCGCLKDNDRPDEQCDDCDNGIHYDDINHVYVDYNAEEKN